MKLNKDARKLSKQLFRLSFTNGRLDEARVRQIASGVAAAKPRHYVGVLKDFQRQVRLELDRRHALIESAQPLSGELSDRILNGLKSKYGQELTAEFRVTPELIGGLRIKLGSRVWDGSVRARLDRLESSFA